MPNSPKCLLYKMNPPLTEAQVQAMADDVPFAQNCVGCPRRVEDRLEKMCFKAVA